MPKELSAYTETLQWIDPSCWSSLLSPNLRARFVTDLSLHEPGSLQPLFFNPFLCISLALAALSISLVWKMRSIKREESRLNNEKRLLLQRADDSERRFRDLLDNAGDAIFFIDPRTGALLETNRQAEALLGYTTHEIETLSLSELFSTHQRRRYFRLVQRVLQDGYGEEGNLTFRRKDGSLFAGAVHARLGRLGEERVVHGVLRDVSAIRQIESELRRKNRDLSLLNELSHLASGNRPLGEMLFEVLSKIVDAFGANGGGVYLLREDGTGLFLAVHQGLEPEVISSIENVPIGVGLVGKAASTGQPKTSSDIGRDYRFRSDAARRAGWKSFSAIPLVAKERSVGVLCLFKRAKQIIRRDELRLLVSAGKQLGGAVEGAELFDALQWQHRMTRATNDALELSRRQLEESVQKLEEANRTLKSLDRMKNNFLALASHELRTPLTYILTASEFLAQKDGGGRSEDERRSVEAILAGGERLRGIVSDLLEVARLESKNLYLGREKIEIGTLFQEVENRVLPVMSDRGLSLEIQKIPSSIFLSGDPDYLKKTILRLVENAIKFTRHGGRIEIGFSIWDAAKIRVNEDDLRPFSPHFFERTLESSYLQMSVRDTGIGIAPEEQVRIFEKFYEIGDHADHFTSHTEFGGKGFGLGLTLVRGMTEAHGGMVWVESPGEGSAFHILLPLFGRGEYDDRTSDKGISCD